MDEEPRSPVPTFFVGESFPAVPHLLAGLPRYKKENPQLAWGFLFSGDWKYKTDIKAILLFSEDFSILGSEPKAHAPLAQNPSPATAEGLLLSRRDSVAQFLLIVTRLVWGIFVLE
jgi:hypothetical protein